MQITERDKQRILKLIKSFMTNNGLLHYTMSDIIYIEDISHDSSKATITMYNEERDFIIRIYTVYYASYYELCSSVIHELTHLFLHEINDYWDLLKRNNAADFFLNELELTYEKITCKVSKIFEQIYLEGIEE